MDPDNKECVCRSERNGFHSGFLYFQPVRHSSKIIHMGEGEGQFSHLLTLATRKYLGIPGIFKTSYDKNYYNLMCLSHISSEMKDTGEKGTM